MKNSPKDASLFVFFLLAVAYPVSAEAYLDPASGSIILQLLLGGVAGVGLFFKLCWKRLRTRIRGEEVKTASENSHGEP